MFEEFIFDIPLYEEIIGGHASLTSVQPFAKGDALGSDFQICAVVNYTRTFSTQLQGAGRELGGR